MVIFTMKYAKVLAENISITMYLVLQLHTIKIHIDFWLLKRSKLKCKIW